MQILECCCRNVNPMLQAGHQLWETDLCRSPQVVYGRARVAQKQTSVKHSLKLLPAVQPKSPCPPASQYSFQTDLEEECSSSPDDLSGLRGKAKEKTPRLSSWRRRKLAIFKSGMEKVIEAEGQMRQLVLCWYCADLCSAGMRVVNCTCRDAETRIVDARD